jgi:undecaprenyl-diphosphatase
VSVAGRLKAADAGGAPSWRRRLRANIADGFALLALAPLVTTRPAWREPTRLAVLLLITATMIAAAMAFLDAPTIEAARRLPPWVFAAATLVTEFGQSGWFLVPIGAALLIVAALASPALPHGAQAVLATVAIRLGFLFAAVAVPSLFGTIAKRLIGRARPFVDSAVDPFHYVPLVWRPEFAGMPSGHATTAFAAAIAFGAIWPRLRPLMWLYALIIAVSRVVLTAHFPSDVIAGAAVGFMGAWLVRDWFAARRLAFVIDRQGEIRALPGPSTARIKRVARNLLAP